MSSSTAWTPSRKWFVTQVTALSALLVAWISAGVWDKTLSIGLVGLVTQAVAGYLVPHPDMSSATPARPALRRPRPFPAGTS